ncbi:hypothetical protein ACLB2K_033201 [Fragaria x ananassa]
MGLDLYGIFFFLICIRFYLILECPSIQDLSLTSCHCENSKFDVSSSSLKSLEIEHCDSRFIYVESFTVSSNSSLLENITLGATSNLKHINVHAKHLKHLIAHLFPEDFRKNFSSPLYGVKHLVVVMPNSQKEVSDIPNFRHALGWMAPSTNQLSFDEQNFLEYITHSSLVGL